jgi:hypothetical protein
MEYVETPSWGIIGPLLIGAYEAELHPTVESIIATAPERVVDVGCAEGYYAVGLARRLPDAEVHAFDLDPEARRLCAAMAERNGVADRVHVAAECTAAALEHLAGPGSLVILDCEGCEVDLLDPARVPSLTASTILVELHDFIRPDASTTVLGRFEGTHRIEIVDAVVRTDWPTLVGISRQVQAKLLFEGRPTDPHPMQWAFMTPWHPPAPS